MTDNSVVVALVMVVGMVLVGGALVLVPRVWHRPTAVPGAAAPASDGHDAFDALDSTDAVMRALTLVQRRYAVLVREHDAVIARNRELEDENLRLALLLERHR